MSDLQKPKESPATALAALEAEAHELVQGSNRLKDNLAEARKKIWRQVLVIWGIGIVLAISYFFVLDHQPATVDQTQKAPVLQLEAGANLETGKSTPLPQVPESLSPGPPLAAREELTRLLDQIRVAQAKKDINLFMEVYGPDFPELVPKKETTLTIWKKFTYVDSRFQLTGLRQESPSTILGKVIWDIKAQEQKTGKIVVTTKSYLVTFSNKSGKWLITNLKADGNKHN
jgi:hypothetical protein